MECGVTVSVATAGAVIFFPLNPDSLLREDMVVVVKKRTNVTFLITLVSSMVLGHNVPKNLRCQRSLNIPKEV